MCFTVQLSICFALRLSALSELLYFISAFCFCQALSEIIFPDSIRNLVEQTFNKRRRRDLNPRAAINDLLPFQGSPFSQLGYFSTFAWMYFLFSSQEDLVKTERVGFEPTRPFGQTVFKTASLWPLRYLSIHEFKSRLRRFHLLFFSRETYLTWRQRVL